MDLLHGQLPPELLEEIGQQIGSDDPQQTAAATSGVFSTLLHGLSQNASTPGGAEALDKALERDHQGGSLLDGLMGVLGGGQQQQQQQQDGGGLGDILGAVMGGGQQQGGGLGDVLGAVMGGGQGGGGLLGGILGSVLGGGAPQSRAQNGGSILGHILGDRQESAAQAVSQQSGLSMGTVMKLMPILAPIVMQVLGRMRAQGNLDTAQLPQVLGGAAQQSAQNSGMGDILGAVLGGGSGGGLLGNVLGSVLGGR